MAAAVALFVSRLGRRNWKVPAWEILSKYCYSTCLLSVPREKAKNLNPSRPYLMLPRPSRVNEDGDIISRREKVEEEEEEDLFYSLQDERVICLNRKQSLQVPEEASCFASTRGGWLGFIDPKDCSLFLTNPFFNKLLELPSFQSLPSILGAICDLQSPSIITHFKVSDRDEYGTVVDPYDFYTPGFLSQSFVRFLALSCPDPFKEDCVALAIQGNDKRLAFCRPGSSSDEGGGGGNWCGLQEDYRPGPPDIGAAYSDKDKLFYTYFSWSGIQAFLLHDNNRKGSKMVLNLDTETLDELIERAYEEAEEKGRWVRFQTRVEKGELGDNIRPAPPRYHLVVLHHTNDLLLVLRHSVDHLDMDVDDDTCETMHFDVFRVHMRYPKLVRITDLDGYSIFLGLNQSFCLLAPEFSGLRPNCIYFSDDQEMESEREYF